MGRLKQESGLDESRLDTQQPAAGYGFPFSAGQSCLSPVWWCSHSFAPLKTGLRRRKRMNDSGCAYFGGHQDNRNRACNGRSRLVQL
jgi:hypothetical protein